MSEHLNYCTVPAQEEGHIEEGREEREKLEGEHFDSEASLCGS